MDNLFGIPMTLIMVALLAIFAVALASVGYVAVANRHMFRMGIRNVRRRGLQTALIVVGLTLATAITTAAFTTGDTVDYSIEKAGYDQLQRVDLSINFQGEESEQSTESVYAPQSAVAALEDRFEGDPDIDGFLPFLFEPVPAFNARTGLSEPSLTLSGIDPERLARLGGLRLAGGGDADLASLGDRDVLLTQNAAEELDANVGDMITVYVQERPAELQVAGIVEDELASAGPRTFDVSGSGGAAVRLDTAQAITGHEASVNFIGVALRGSLQESYLASDDVVTRLEPFVQSVEGRTLLDSGSRMVQVETMKQDAVEQAQSLGNMFTTIFLVLGLFSIASGVMLIFMIFVMLAAERKSEMGMARAVGAQRAHLVQSFMSEGMVYNLIAGMIGAAIGLAAALGLVVGFLRISGGEDFEFITAHVTWRSLIISYCLGVSLTFITVVVSSIKVASLNIVGAIRGVEQESRRKPRRSVDWKWLALGVPALVIPPLGVWLLFRKGLDVAWVWILAPAAALLAGGALLIARGGGSMSEFLAGFGFSVLPLAIAMLATHYRAPGRVVWTLVGAWMAFYWMAPFSVGEALLGADLEGDIEMFVLSGVMVVIAFTLIIIFNAGFLAALFRAQNGHRYRKSMLIAGVAAAIAVAGFAVGDRGDGAGQVLYLLAGLVAVAAVSAWAAIRFPSAAPALKMGVAYPLANRFRTGMTIAMFSLIVFSIVTFSAVNANFSATVTGADGDGGWDVVATSSRNSRVADVARELDETGAPIAGDISAAGRTTTFTGGQEILHDGEWATYPVIAGDTGFFTVAEAKLAGRARGYDSDRAVFEAVARDPSLALVDASDWGPYAFTWSVDKEDAFEPLEVTFRNPLTGAQATVKVIGVLGIRLPAETVAGLYVNSDAYAQVYGEPVYRRTYLRLSGDDVEAGARAIESALAGQGVQADGVRHLIEAADAQEKAFTRMFQAFMALGLIVGIIALGVVAFRSVVERRQQIGMLRAIGYQTGTVALTFVLESGFIALMGILSGMVGGVIVARNLFTTGQLAGEGVEFMLPWTEVLVFTAAALVVSLAMTWLPSRAAARVPVAEALRYE